MKKLLCTVAFLFSSACLAQEIKVLVIDTGIYPHSKIKSFLTDGFDPESADYKDSHGHGTHIAGIVVYGDYQKFPSVVCPSVKITSCQYFDIKNTDAQNAKNFRSCLKMAENGNFNIVNYSGGGEGFDSEELESLQKITDNGAVVVAAAGNEKSDLIKSPYYPASYFLNNNLINFYVVGSMGYDKVILPSSNYTGGLFFDFGENILSTIPGEQMGYMTGTSQAAAMFTHRILLSKCKAQKRVKEREERLQKERSRTIIVKRGGFRGKSSPKICSKQSSTRKSSSAAFGNRICHRSSK